MKFCPECGSMLRPKKDDKGNVILICEICGYSEKNQGSLEQEYTISSKINHSPGESELVLVDETKMVKTLPTIQVICPKCGNNRAYYYQLQTRRADEGMTTFLRCTKCNYVWRRY
ncbi:MAG: transcription factor S [Candidatus Baldrarchaeia archaeon]